MKKMFLTLSVFLIVLVVMVAYLFGLHHGRIGEEVSIAREALAAPMKSTASPVKALKERGVYYPGTEDLAAAPPGSYRF